MEGDLLDWKTKQKNEIATDNIHMLTNHEDCSDINSENKHVVRWGTVVIHTLAQNRLPVMVFRWYFIYGNTSPALLRLNNPLRAYARFYASPMIFKA